MKFGVNLVSFGPGASPESLSRWVAFTENLGYHFVMLGDHVAITPDVQGRYPAPFYDPFTTLGWLAGMTRRVELGFTVIVLPYRHPLETARMAANLDRLSGGRLIFGIGVGWARQEFQVLGLPFERRGAMTDDYLGALKAAWTQDVASYSGRFVSFKDVYTAPRPLRKPHPPIWVGGSSEAALRRTDEISARSETPEELLLRVREPYEWRLSRLSSAYDDSPADHTATISRLRREAVEAQRRALGKLAQRGEVHGDVLRELQRELDVEQSRLE